MAELLHESVVWLEAHRFTLTIIANVLVELGGGVDAALRAPHAVVFQLGPPRAYDGTPASAFALEGMRFGHRDKFGGIAGVTEPQWGSEMAMFRELATMVLQEAGADGRGRGVVWGAPRHDVPARRVGDRAADELPAVPPAAATRSGGRQGDGRGRAREGEDEGGTKEPDADVQGRDQRGDRAPHAGGPAQGRAGHGEARAAEGEDVDVDGACAFGARGGRDAGVVPRVPALLRLRRGPLFEPDGLLRCVSSVVAVPLAGGCWEADLRSVSGAGYYYQPHAYSSRSVMPRPSLSAMSAGLASEYCDLWIVLWIYINLSSSPPQVGGSLTVPN